MADIKAIAEELIRLSSKEVQQIAMVMKDEYDIEPAAGIEHQREQLQRAVVITSPKQYGISLLNRKRKKK